LAAKHTLLHTSYLPVEIDLEAIYPAFERVMLAIA
jgi:hypothetical protein